MTILDLVAPESRREIQERLQRRASGLPTEAAYEFLGLRADGTRFPCRTQVVGVELADGPAVMVFHTDLTETRQAMQALSESEERYRTLLHQSAEGVMVLDDTGSITEWNLAMERITGMSRCEAVGRSAWDVATALSPTAERTPAVRDRLRNLVRTSLRRAEDHSKSREAVIQRTDGQLRSVAQTTFAIRIAGRTNLGVLIDDVTDRKRAEEARTRTEAALHQAQKMEALGTLSGGIAHDFNNILTAIVANAELLSTQLPRGSETQEMATEILTSSLRGADLTRQIPDVLTAKGRAAKATRPRCCCDRDAQSPGTLHP